ncbi:hypothetical protein OROGR_024565 [Orobanche gracilis]
MASIIHTLSAPLFFAFILSARPTFSADSSESSPSPSPQPSTDDISPPPSTPSPSPAVPNSPPAPPRSDLAPNSPSPAPSPGDDAVRKKSPSPAPVVDGDVSHEDQSSGVDPETKDDSSGGMSGGKKTGVAIGVIAAVCIVGVGGLVYKKRQRNIQRSQYGYAGRREML